MGALWNQLAAYKRREGGITDQELARRTGISHTRFSAWSHPDFDTTQIQPRTLVKLAAGTGLPLLGLIVDAGVFSADELGAMIVHRGASDLTNDELLDLVRARMVPEPEAVGDEAEIDQSQWRDYPPAPARPGQGPRLVNNGPERPGGSG